MFWTRTEINSSKEWNKALVSPQGEPPKFPKRFKHSIKCFPWTFEYRTIGNVSYIGDFFNHHSPDYIPRQEIFTLTLIKI